MLVGDAPETTLRELMDDPDCDPVRLERTLRRFRFVNPLVSRWGTVYRRFLRPALGNSTAPTLLDIGCGGGDVSRRLRKLARADGIDLRVLGIDTDPRAIAVAERTTRDDAVRFRHVNSRELVAAGDHFDAVISNHVLHHLDGAGFASVLSDSEQLGTRITVHADIRHLSAAHAGHFHSR